MDTKHLWKVQELELREEELYQMTLLLYTSDLIQGLWLYPRTRRHL